MNVKPAINLISLRSDLVSAMIQCGQVRDNELPRLDTLKQALRTTGTMANLRLCFDAYDLVDDYELGYALANLAREDATFGRLLAQFVGAASNDRMFDNWEWSVPPSLMPVVEAA